MQGFVIVDKPVGITSQGAVSRVKRALSQRRVGHGGTLDPLATGVLPVFVGRATRAASLMLEADKSYRAGFVLGVATDTCDLTGSVVARSEKRATEQEVSEALQGFLGVQWQMPPMYSAVKVGGKKLYEYARDGKEVERAARQIEVYSIEYCGLRDGVYTIDVSCSKGTYIRQLVHDIGIALGCYASLAELRRTRTGRFSIEEAVQLDALTWADLRPTDQLFDYPKLTVDERGEQRVRVGAAVLADSAKPEPQDGQCYRVYAQSGEFLCIAESKPQSDPPHTSALFTIKSFFEV